MPQLDITFVMRDNTPCLYVKDKDGEYMFTAEHGALIRSAPDKHNAHHVTLTQEDLFRAYKQILREKGVL